jgi:hypothetical protein
MTLTIQECQMDVLRRDVLYRIRNGRLDVLDHSGNPLYFAGAGLAALLIAWATIFARAMRVARSNPVHAQRYE